MSIDKELLLKLRKASYAGFSECKKALEETNNDFQLAIEWLRKRGSSKAIEKNALKESKEGGTWVKKDHQGVVILELNSETDFTANNKQFCELAEEILDVVLKNKVDDVQSIKLLQMKNGSTVEENCLHLSSITGEKVSLRRASYFPISSSDSVSCYRHNNGKISTFVVLDKKLEDEQIKGLSIHYAANNPKFLTKDQVDPNWLELEKSVISSIVQKENKPEQFREKIVTERLKKIVSQHVFLEQSYLFNAEKSVSEILLEIGANVKHAVYFELGV